MSFWLMQIKAGTIGYVEAKEPLEAAEKAVWVLELLGIEPQEVDLTDVGDRPPYEPVTGLN